MSSGQIVLCLAVILNVYTAWICWREAWAFRKLTRQYQYYVETLEAAVQEMEQP